MFSLRHLSRVVSPSLHRILVVAASCPSGTQEVHTDGRPALVIFDKNGTLVDFHDHWSPWIQGFVKRLEDKTSLKLQDRIYERLDICQYTGKARSGLLGHGANWQVMQEVQDILVSLGVNKSKAQWLGDICWQESRPETTFNATQLGDVPTLFKQLKELNIKIAVCTSDTRWRTVKILQELGVGEDLDHLICGDDRESVPKPDGHNIIHICNALGVDPSKSCLIGDTLADMEMARSAGTGNAIGVLTGVGNRLELSALANHVFPGVTEAVEMIVGGHIDNQGTTSDKAVVRDGKKASLVIFDKDGTLLCFNSLWTPWAERVIDKMEKKTGLKLHDRVLTAWGYSLEKRSWGAGVFAEGTMRQCQDIVSEILQEHGIKPEGAESIVKQCWDNSGFKKSLKLFDDPSRLFQILKDNDIKVAICTADSRASTLQFLDNLGLTTHVDAIVCGDDKESIPKPAPKNALSICSTLNVDPAQTIVIGDTIADLGMGRSAELGATVGVLSGVGGVEELGPLADHVVPSIKHVLKLALPEGQFKALQDMEQ